MRKSEDYRVEQVKVHSKYYIPEGALPCTPEEYGKRLKKRRDDCGYTLKDLAEAIGSKMPGKTPSIQTISNIESGNVKSVNREYVRMFAEKLECTCAYLLGGATKIDGNWGDTEIPLQLFDFESKVEIAKFVNGYKRDPELCERCMEILLLGNDERRYFKEVLDKMLRFLTVWDSSK